MQREKMNKKTENIMFISIILQLISLDFNFIHVH